MIAERAQRHDAGTHHGVTPKLPPSGNTTNRIRRDATKIPSLRLTV